MLDLNSIKTKKPLTDGDYTATVKSYEVGDKLYITFTIEDQDYKQDFDETATTGDKRVWSPIKLVLENLATYYYLPSNTEMLDYIVANQIKVQVSLSNNRNVRIHYNKATVTPAELAKTLNTNPIVKRRNVAATAK